MRRQRIGMLQTIGIVIALVLGGVSALAAQPIVVTNMVDGEPGSLREAIASAEPGDAISIEPVGCSPCTIALTLGELVIDKNLTIAGPGPNLLTVSGEGASRVFRIVSGVAAQLQGLAVRNGNGLGGGSFFRFGGGILNEGALTLLNTIVAENSAIDRSGGGVYSSNLSSLTVRNSVFTLNRAAQGGGIGSDGLLLLSGSTLTSNAADGGSGGGVNATAGGTIVGSTIAGNAATASGGGVFVFLEGSFTLVNCTISGNSASFGGGGFAQGLPGPATTVTLINTTVTANNATTSGGGLQSGFAILALNNSIVAGNSPLDIPAGASSINNSSRVGGDVTAILNSTLADNGGPTLTHALVPGSPAINAGDTSFLPLDSFDVDGDGNTTELLPIDQRGAPRVFGGGVDQGAFEVVCTAIGVTPSTLPLAPAVGVAFSQPLSASGGTGPYMFGATGQLPPGLALDPDTGVLSGTPTASGTYSFTVTVTDAFGCIGTQTYTVTVADPGCGIDVGPATLATPYVATLYYQPLPITPAGAYTVRVSAGALPTGVYLFAIGRSWLLGGIPATPGEYTFALTATKKDSACARTRTYTVTVPKTVLPQLTCVVKTGSKYTARFGYDNSTGAVVTIPVGPDNAFTPGAQDRQQVTTFQPGRVTNAFSVLFTVKNHSSDLAIWYLRGPDGVRRPVNITTATSRCQ